MTAWKRHWITEGMDALESLLAHRPVGALCAGDRPSIADVFLFPQAVNTERGGLALGQWPRIAAIVSRLRVIPAFAENAPVPIVST